MTTPRLDSAARAWLAFLTIVACGESGNTNPVDIPEGCGDGEIAGDEQCDDEGESLDCNVNCTLSECGDGVRNVTATEACDDGNTANGDGCSDDCLLELPAFCGDGNLNEARDEQCDDGNTAPGDGCSPTCQIEAELCGIAALSCGGGGIQGSTADPAATSTIGSYTCLGEQNKSGPEMIYEWIADRNDSVGVFLEGNLTLDVVVLEAQPDCGLGACVAAGLAGATFTPVLGRRYLIVVDSDPDTSAPFFVGMSCP